MPIEKTFYMQFAISEDMQAMVGGEKVLEMAKMHLARKMALTLVKHIGLRYEKGELGESVYVLECTVSPLSG